MSYVLRKKNNPVKVVQLDLRFINTKEHFVGGSMVILKPFNANLPVSSSSLCLEKMKICFKQLPSKVTEKKMLCL